MKKLVLMTVLAGVLPLSLMAQEDDLYFTPKKSSEYNSVTEKSTYYCGSDRNVDEYNHRGKYWSHYQKIGTDKKGNDIIQFTKGIGVYPDSVYIDTTFVGKYYDTIVDNDDYRYTRRMSRWDGYYDPWYYSYSWGFGPYWGYGPRWRYGYYDPFYDPFYDSWYYSGYYGYGYPYYGYAGWYGGWYSPWYYGGYYGYPYYGGYVSYNRPAGTMNHSYSSETASFPRGSFGGSRMSAGTSRAAEIQDAGVRVGNRGLFGGSRSIDDRRSYDNGDNRIPSRSYNNYPSRDNYNQVPTRSYNSGGFNSGSSFGGSVHSGGGFSGGGFSGGGAGGGGFHSGGSFGGRR